MSEVPPPAQPARSVPSVPSVSDEPDDSAVPAERAEPAASDMPTGVTLVFRLPRSAYLAVLFLFFCVMPLAFSASGGDEGGPAGWTWRLALLLLPLLAALFIARTATVVGPRGFKVRAPFGSRTVPWEQAQGLSVGDRAIYVVTAEGVLRLPCVRVPDLPAIARVSGGRLPELPEAPRKYVPARRRRRRRR